MVTLLCVGAIREAWIKQGIAEYEKRCSRFGGIATIEVAKQQSKESEGKLLLSRQPKSSYLIACSENGAMLASRELAAKLGSLNSQGYSNICFAVGGAEGLSEEVMKQAGFVMSFSALTFPHQLFRLLLAEQVYRAYTINANVPYNK